MWRQPRQELWSWRGNCLTLPHTVVKTLLLPGDLESRSIAVSHRLSGNADHPQTAPRSCPRSPGCPTRSPSRTGRALPASDAASRDPFSIPSEVKASIRVLVVDDERTLRESCASVLQMDGYNVTLVGRGEEALDTVKRRKFDIILVDLYMSQISGLEILQAALQALQGHHRRRDDRQSQRHQQHRGAARRRLGLPARSRSRATHLQVLIGRASHAVMMSREAQDLRVQLMKQHGHSDKIALIGISPLFRKAVELARKVAATDASVFISGESGTGKEVIAQFIHQNSRRASRTLVPINCAALPEPLLESEMFGHRKGAFTGADRDKPGLLETAQRRHAVPRRADRDDDAAPGQAPAGDPGRRGAPGRQRAAGRGGGRAVHLGHQPGAAGGGGHRRASGRPVLPPARRADQAAAAPQAARGHPAAGQPLPDATTGSATARWATGCRGSARRASASCVRGRGEATFASFRTSSSTSRCWPSPIRSSSRTTSRCTTTRPSGRPRARCAAGVMDEAYHAAKDRVVAQFEKEYLTRLVSRAGGNMSKAARLASIDRTTLYRLMDKHAFHRDETPGVA